MELQKKTRQNIVKTTGLSFFDLLQEKPVGDVRLSKIKRHQISGTEDALVRGNPQLTMGCITTIEAVDAYFEKKASGKNES